MQTDRQSHLVRLEARGQRKNELVLLLLLLLLRCYRGTERPNRHPENATYKTERPNMQRNIKSYAAGNTRVSQGQAEGKQKVSRR